MPQLIVNALFILVVVFCLYAANNFGRIGPLIASGLLGVLIILLLFKSKGNINRAGLIFLIIAVLLLVGSVLVNLNFI